MTFDGVNPLDRWPALEAYLTELEKRVEQADPAKLIATVEVADLAEKGRVSLETMIKRLEAGGGKPFKLGKVWVIRELSLADYYRHQERERRVA